jgi:hypothetical protein
MEHVRPYFISVKIPIRKLSFIFDSFNYFL